MDLKESLQPTPEASFDSNATDVSIHQSKPKVNPSKQNSSEKDSQNDVDTETLDNGEASEYNDDAQFSRKSRTKKYIKISQYAREQLNRKLIALYRGIDDGIADDIAIDIGNTVYIVDSGKDRGNISFGVSEMFEFDDEKYKADFVRSRNDDTISKMHISDELSERLGGGLGYNRKSNLQSEHRSDLSDDKQQSENNSQGVQGEIRGSENRDRVRGLNEKAQFSLPNRATDAAYLKAVEDGDMETAQRMVDEAARKAGYTVKAYHGTDNEFTVFNKNKIGSNTGGAFYGNGFYFSTSEHDANNYGKKIMPVYLRVGKTLNLDGSSWTYDLGIEEKKSKVKVEVVKTHIEKAPRGFVNLHYTTKDAPNVWKSISNVSPMQLTDDETGKKFAEKKLNPESSILPRDIKNLAELARINGYDSIKGGGTNIGDVGIEYVLFDAENIKSADPVTYDDNGNVIPLSKRFNVSAPDIRFSLPNKNVKRFALEVDSEGNQLTEAQQEFFKDSVVRDAEGNLLVVYHGTNVKRKFYKFNTKESPAWFTPAPGYANAFTRGEGKKAVYRVYLNITNPLWLGNVDGVADEEAVKYLSALSKIDITTLKDILSEEKGEHVWRITNSPKFKALAKKQGFDGFVAREGGVTSWAIFSPEQVKSTDNKTPTSNPDLRFSLPNKGGEAKKKAERSRAKTYTRSDSNAIVDVMIGDAVFGYGEYVGTLKGKGNIVDALWVKLNSTDEKGRKKYAFKLNKRIIKTLYLSDCVHKL